MPASDLIATRMGAMLALLTLSCAATLGGGGAVKSDVDDLRLSLDRYLLGLSDSLPILTAQASDFTARSQLLAARRQLISDRISLARALGGDWMEEEMENRREASKRQGKGK